MQKHKPKTNTKGDTSIDLIQGTFLESFDTPDRHACRKLMSMLY